jgi:hypothetical protein
LEFVLDLDDENPDLWYLMGVNANNRPVCDEETATESFSTAKTMLEEMLEKDPSQEVSWLFDISRLFTIENESGIGRTMFASQGDFCITTRWNT